MFWIGRYRASPPFSEGNSPDMAGPGAQKLAAITATSAEVVNTPNDMSGLPGGGVPSRLTPFQDNKPYITLMSQFFRPRCAPDHTWRVSAPVAFQRATSRLDLLVIPDAAADFIVGPG